MTKTNKPFKFEIESTTGTLTDLSNYVTSVDFTETKPSLWLRIRDWWNNRKIKRIIDNFPTTSVEITGVFKPELIPIPCATCGKPSVGAIATFDNDGNIEINAGDIQGKFKAYCAEHAPRSE